LLLANLRDDLEASIAAEKWEEALAPVEGLMIVAGLIEQPRRCLSPRLQDNDSEA
jgi:hypothetical protein